MEKQNFIIEIQEIILEKSFSWRKNLILEIQAVNGSLELFVLISSTIFNKQEMRILMEDYQNFL